MPGKKWSVYFQNPEYLERTRMFLIAKEFKPLIRRWCGLRDGMKVLDVGCGTGYFTRLLAAGDAEIQITGLDLEDLFIDYAREEARRQGLGIEFIQGDALALPFADQSFDLVTSHTFFTSIPDPARAMAEMKRVLRPGGLVASVTCMGLEPAAYDNGLYPAECAWQDRFTELYVRFQEAAFTVDPLENRLLGVEPAAVPRFFARSGLKNVSAYPIGKVFSLSNAAVSREEKRRYIDLFQVSEEKKLDAFMALPEMAVYVSPQEAEELRRLLRLVCDWRREHLDENAVWEWQGDANLLVTGIKE